ncbi:hypothetical protein K9N50_09495 [bacterium]|nr:hypothetical protein [bacterium]
MLKNKDINDKKRWTKPQLIILVRSTPAESVLSGCKYAGHPFPGPQSGFNLCTWVTGCAPCAEGIKS